MPDEKEVEYVDFSTKAEFDLALGKFGEYSCSLPTGTTIGKKWFCNRDAYADEPRRSIARAELKMGNVFPDWWQGEYQELDPPDPKRVAIIWRKVRVVPTKE